MLQSALRVLNGIHCIPLYRPVQRTEQKNEWEIIHNKDDLNNPKNSEESDKDTNVSQQK